MHAILEGYQKAAALDPAKEADLFTAYNAFAIADESYESPLNAWVHASSKKYQPYAARAEYYYGMGWASRGSQWASETKQEQLAKMTRYFGKSVEDTGRVLQINNQVMLPYCLLIGMTSAHGHNEEASLVVQKALAINPTSYWVRATYLHFIAPRWGGSYKQMQAFIDDAMPHVKQNGKLKLLQGLPYREAGKMDALIKKYSAAERYYTKALSYGDNHGILLDRAKVRYRQANYEDALKDINRAIELYQEESDYYYWRAQVYEKLKQYLKASKDIGRAYQLAPADVDVQKERKWLASKLIYEGHELAERGRADSAINYYNAAQYLNPDDGDVYYRRARASVDLHRYDSALLDLKRAIQIDPNQFGYYQSLDWILAKRRDWDRIIAYWSRYIAMHPDNSRAYVERGGAYYHKGDMRSAVADAKAAADMGNDEGKEAYEKFKDRAD